MNNDSKIYKLTKWKKDAALNGGCDICPKHLKENQLHTNRKPRRSWKFAFKQPRQYIRERGSL